MKLTVIIVNYNVRHFLEQCLTSVILAMRDIKGEIIVVDNNSADGSCSMVRAEFPQVKLISNSENTGFSRANNQALRIASGEYILLLNPDTLVEENTFVDCIGFMDKTPEAAAAGVKMIDGNGKFLPESKRGFPTPLAAFYKITGINKLFKGSRHFNHYYLGHLSENEIHQIEVISGAFMFIRRETIEKVGLLDEEYFMYGEDIDLSYRLIKEGYLNYYLPQPSIIHYKGESTRRSDFNYTRHFYRAMLIFVKKHLSKANSPLLWIINLAIFLRAGLSFLKRAIRITLLPLSDWLILFILYKPIVRSWELFRYGGNYSYPNTLDNLIIPGYITVWILSVVLWRGYRNPLKISNLIKGLISGIVTTFIIYAFLPTDLRFSRAILVLGSSLALVIIPLLRYFLSLVGLIKLPGTATRPKRVLIVSNEDEYDKIQEIIEKSSVNYRCVGRVRIIDEEGSGQSLGNTDQLSEIVRINTPDELIFGSKAIPSSRIIEMMQLLSGRNVDFKIARTGSDFVIGSRSKLRKGEIYSISLSGKNKL